MLFILIPIAWLAIVTLVVAICRMAARGDAIQLGVTDRRPRVVGDGLVIWEDPRELAA
jgi:hypothetical protein